MWAGPRVRRLGQLGLSLTRWVCPPPIAHPMIRRSMFTNEYLNLDNFNRRRQSSQLMVHDEAKFKSGLREAFEATGLQNVFTEDLERYLFLARSTDDTEFMGRAILASLDESAMDVVVTLSLVRWFFTACGVMGEAQAALNMWLDPRVEAVMKNATRAEHKSTVLILYTTLYRQGMYTELVHDFEGRHEHPGLNIDHGLLAMAAWYRIGTQEAFQTASKHLNLMPFTRGETPARKGSRAYLVHALLCYRLQHYGRAYDSLRPLSDRGVIANLPLNLRLLILVQVGRLEEALGLIKKHILSESAAPGSSRRVSLSLEVMAALRDKVRAEHSASSDMVAELTSVCQALDQVAILVDTTVEELILTPISRQEPRTEHLRSRVNRRDFTHNRLS